LLAVQHFDLTRSVAAGDRISAFIFGNGVFDFAAGVGKIGMPYQTVSVA